MIGTNQIDFLRSAVDERQQERRRTAETQRLVRRLNDLRRLRA